MLMPGLVLGPFEACQPLCQALCPFHWLRSLHVLGYCLLKCLTERVRMLIHT